MAGGNRIRLLAETSLDLPFLSLEAATALLGAISGYGISQAIWELPRIYGVAGALDNQFTFSLAAWQLIAFFSAVLTFVTLCFGLWPFRRTARDAIKER